MDRDAATESSVNPTARKRFSKPAEVFTRLVKKKPLGTLGAIIVLLLLLTGIFAGFLAPYGMNETAVENRLAPPSDQFRMGTDDLGRDIFSRIIYGARISTIVGLGAATVSTLISLILGMLSGYIGGVFDLILQRLVDAWMCIPGLIILMVMMDIIGPGILSIILVIGVHSGITGSRIVRGAVIAIRENAYVTAAKAVGSSTPKILIRHILPNIMAPVIILFTLRVPGAILSEAGLSFLGFGVPPPFPSWGAMLAGRTRWYMFVAPWMVLWPGAALAGVVYGANMFGDALRDILDPRLRGGAGRYGVKAKKMLEKKNTPMAGEEKEAI